MAKPIKRTLQDLIDRRAAEWLDEQVVRLGKDATQVIDTGTPGILWARLANGKPIKIRAGTANVPSRFDLRLKVGRKKSQPAIWQVITTLEDYDEPAGGGELTYHHPQHEEGGSDRLDLSWKQIVARSVRVKNAASFIVRVFGDPDLTPNGYVLIPTKDLVLSSYVPATGARFVAIESDDNGALSIQSGSTFAAPGAGTVANYPEPAAGKYTRALVLLFEGQTALLDEHIKIPKPPSFNPANYSGVSHAHTLDALTDVYVPLPADGDFLRWDAYTQKWVAEGVFLDEILDVNAPTPMNGQVLTWDAYAEEWIAADPGSGSFDLAAAIHGATGASPAMGDELPGDDASASFALRKFTIQQIYDLYLGVFETDINFDAVLGTLGYVKTVSVDSEDGEIVAFNSTNGNVIRRGNVLIADVLAGWEEISQTWTFASADDPVYQIYVAGNVTANPSYKNGNRVKCTNNSTTFYGIIHKIGAYDSGNNRTPVDIFGGTDYDLANLTITAPYISKVKSPDGFPMQEEKWSHEIVASNSPARSVAAGSGVAVANNWYGGALLSPTGPSLDIPLGNWRLSYFVVGDYSTNLAAVANIGMRVTLSTANNTESHPEFTTGFTVTLPISATAVQRATYEINDRALTLTAKQTFYLNLFTGTVTGTAPALSFNPGGVFRTVIRVVDAYL